MLAVVVLALAAGARAEEAPKRERWKLLVLDVQSADLDKGQRDTLAAAIAARAARFPTVQVASSADAGCDENATSCLGELAGARSADFVLTTRAGKLDAEYVVSLQVFDARIATAVGRASVQGWSLAELPEKIAPVVDELVAKATGDAAPVDAQPTAPPPAPVTVSSPLRLGLEIGGGVGLGAGALSIALGVTPALLYGQTKNDLATQTAHFDGSTAALAKAARVRQDAVDLRDLYNGVGRWGVLAGGVLVAGGGGALAAAFLLPGEAP